MPKNLFFSLTVVMLSILLSLLAACGPAPTSNSGPASVATPPPGENLYVLDGYTPQGATAAGQQIVAFHPTSANPSTLLTLPAGLTSLDHQRLYVATPQGNRTTVAVINTRNGATLRSLVINGSYSTAGQSIDNAVISFDGHWLALREAGQSGNTTTIALIDTQAGKLVKTIHLNGSFTLDALSPDGTALYLLQRLSDGSGHYYVQLYNVTENELYQYPIIDKTEINDPRMTGTALARQVASNGTAAYTLYIDTYRNIAFVHVLPMDPGFPFAHCIDLPVGKSADLLRYYTLALSSDGTTLYAVNGALGVASEITVSSSDVFDDKIVATAHFNPGDVRAGDTQRVLYNGAVLSPDQQALYFAGAKGIWAASTSDLHAQRNTFKRYLAQQSFTGIALSADGRTLFAVDPASGITLLNAASGQPGQVIQGPAHSPWGIAWVTG